MWSWLILNMIFTIAAVRSSWTLFMALLLFNAELILLAIGYMIDRPSLLVAGNAVGFVVSLCVCEYVLYDNCIQTNSCCEIRLVWVCGIMVRRHNTIYNSHFPDVQIYLAHIALEIVKTRIFD